MAEEGCCCSMKWIDVSGSVLDNSCRQCNLLARLSALQMEAENVGGREKKRNSKRRVVERANQAQLHSPCPCPAVWMFTFWQERYWKSDDRADEGGPVTFTSPCVILRGRAPSLPSFLPSTLPQASSYVVVVHPPYRPQFLIGSELLKNKKSIVSKKYLQSLL
jgi:hypothetical protein